MYNKNKNDNSSSNNSNNNNSLRQLGHAVGQPVVRGLLGGRRAVLGHIVLHVI